jgi:NADH pyrophosphatase NudC (nudix superfamily)
MNFKCPGQDKRNIKTEMLRCPGCGYEVEIFSDEVKVSCPKCKNLLCRKRLPTCIDWCRFAKECIGEDKYKDLKGG